MRLTELNIAVPGAEKLAKTLSKIEEMETGTSSGTGPFPRKMTSSKHNKPMLAARRKTP